MTVRGAEKLRAELQELKAVARPRIIKAIAEARAHGDLRENAEYHAAREEQGFVEGRIAEIESKLATAQIIDVSQVNAGGRVVFGATVEVLNLETEEETRYQIVGEDEADIKEGLISITSPMARALVGKIEGDVVAVQTPGGRKEYEVLQVLYL
jgi:transcription elongation factor GreA